jgi:hypothetical protein
VFDVLGLSFTAQLSRKAFAEIALRRTGRRIGSVESKCSSSASFKEPIGSSEKPWDLNHQNSTMQRYVALASFSYG